MSAGTLTQSLAPSHQRWWNLGLAAIFIILSIQYSYKVGDEHRSAILRWRPQLQQLYDINIYERYSYPNPPIMALVLKPLVELPPVAASLVWFYVKVGLTFLAIPWAFRLIESADRPFPIWAKVIAVILSLRPIMGDLSHGNVNLFILFLVVATLLAFHRGRDFSAGLVLGLAIACKVTPALFVPYFLWKRAWRTLAGCTLGLVLFLLLVPGVFLGMKRNVELLYSWYGCMVQPFVVAGQVTTEHPNQSLPGLVYRWFTHNPSFSDKGIPQEYSNVAEVDLVWIRGFLKGCLVIFALLVMWSCRTPLEPRHGWRLAAEFSVILLGMLLFSERTWKHHCVTLLVPFGVMTYYLATTPASWKLRGYLAGTLLAVAILMLSTSTGLVEDWARSAKMAQADGAYVWAYLLLLAAMVTLLRTREESSWPVDDPIQGQVD
jgi:hypothetical protein